MYNLIYFYARKPPFHFKATPSLYRFYRTKYRKKVTSELNKPSLYDDSRNAPTKLLQSNLFTPESAGPRELPMLCFWIVNYGFADYSILTRYVQSSLDILKKLRVKGLALILHSVSKHLSNHKIVLLESHELEGAQAETTARHTLVKKCILMILESSPLLHNLFANAVPKDLGMIALSIVNIYEIFSDECSLYPSPHSQHQEGNSPGISSEDSQSLPSNHKSVSGVINKLLHKLSKEIVPKLPFCEAEEFAAFAKAFSRIKADWSSLFLRELALEFSSLLTEKIEDLQMLSQNKFIGEDLVQQLNNLPRDLSAITCSLSKCRISEPKFWERAQKALFLIIQLRGSNFGISPIDPVTLTLLCTSMSNYCDVRVLVEEILRISDNSDNSQTLIGFNTSLKSLKDKSLAEKFLSHIDFDTISEVNHKLLSQFILNFARSGLTANSQLREAIVSMIHRDLGPEILSSVFVSSNSLSLDSSDRLEVVHKLSLNLPNLETSHLINVLLNSLQYLGDKEVKNMCNSLLEVLSNRVHQVPFGILPSLLVAVLDNFGGDLNLIRRICSRIDQNFSYFEPSDLLELSNRIKSMGLNVNKLFSRNISKLKGESISVSSSEHSFTFDPEFSEEPSMTQFEPVLDSNTELELPSMPIPDSQSPSVPMSIARSPSQPQTIDQFDTSFQFSPSDQKEISIISRFTRNKSENVRIFSSEDFADEDTYDWDSPEITFELSKYPSKPIVDQFRPSEETESTLKSQSPGVSAVKNPVSGASSLEDLRSKWHQVRQSVQ